MIYIVGQQVRLTVTVRDNARGTIVEPGTFQFLF